jgi:hypothetical protein
MNKLLMATIILLIAGCKEKYLSPVASTGTGYLVVDGVINNRGEQTNIKLSRTTSLDGNVSIHEEAGAMVKLESNTNVSFDLAESNVGTYSINNLQLDTSLQYRLNIKTNQGEEYLSDYVRVRNNPPIDSISWVRESEGVQLYVNTHDPQNNTRYYQWEYSETWEFHSAFSASLKYAEQQPPFTGVVPRDRNDPEIYTCWQYNSSSSILLGSSAKLSDDIIHLPLLFIENGSQKLSVLYSVLLTQYSWSKEGYGFLERMKKNTESLGSVFDAQPSELNGNIHCVSNPGQPVIGFFNICTIQQSRIFIYRAQVPDWRFNESCYQIVVENNPDSIAAKAGGMLPVAPEKYAGPSTILTFYAAPEICVDCTLRGSNIKPIYWP